jgi:hypothetical protein
LIFFALRCAHSGKRLRSDENEASVVFEIYRELIEQVASDAYDAGRSVDDFSSVPSK